jgi:hypothetical protein
MFCDKDFADGANAVRSSLSAAAATVGIATAVTVAGKKRAGNSAGLPISVTEKPWKRDWIKETARELIAYGRQNVSLWIKVPLRDFPQAKSSPRWLLHRLPPCNAANQHTKPE